jgi:membrane dipeptidase
MNDSTNTSAHEFAVELRKTRYDGYRSYSYLEEADYEQFVLAPELGRVPLYDLGLDEQQVERTRRLIDENVIISLHDHPQVFPADMTQVRDYIRTGREHTG